MKTLLKPDCTIMREIYIMNNKEVVLHENDLIIANRLLGKKMLINKRLDK